MLTSKVPDHKGECKPVWLNTSVHCIKFNGGASGFFRNTKTFKLWPFPVKTGPEFYGIVRGSVVYPIQEDAISRNLDGTPDFAISEHTHVRVFVEAGNASHCRYALKEEKLESLEYPLKWISPGDPGWYKSY